MKLDTNLPVSPLADCGAAAAHAEALGFDAGFTSETSHDPFLPLVPAALATSRLTLGTSIAVAFPRSPMVLAQLAWDLQAASSGRFVLGLGTQVKAHNERRFSVPWGEPGPRLRELVQTMHAIWDTFQNGARPSFEGRFYRFSLMTPFFNPGPLPCGRPKVYIAGVNEYVCKLAGELCDGFHVHPLHTTRYLDEVILPLVRQGAHKAGRAPSAVALASSVFVVTGDDEDARRKLAQRVKQQIAFYASTPAYAPVLQLHGWGEISRRLTELSKRGAWTAMTDEISDEMLEAFAVVAHPDDVVERVKRKYEGRLDRLSFYFPSSMGDDGRKRELARAFNGAA